MGCWGQSTRVWVRNSCGARGARGLGEQEKVEMGPRDSAARAPARTRDGRPQRIHPPRRLLARRDRRSSDFGSLRVICRSSTIHQTEPRTLTPSGVPVSSPIRRSAGAAGFSACDRSFDRRPADGFLDFRSVRNHASTDFPREARTGALGLAARGRRRQGARPPRHRGRDRAHGQASSRVHPARADRRRRRRRPTARRS